jgi:cytochrome c556
MRNVIVFVVAVLAWGGAVGFAQQPGVRTVATTRQLMLEVVTPTSNAVFDVAIGEPDSDEAWEALAASARLLAESGNLLMIGDRVRDDDEWMVEAQAQVDAAVEALTAIEARNVDDIIASGDALYQTCESCHMRYL